MRYQQAAFDITRKLVGMVLSGHVLAGQDASDIPFIGEVMRKVLTKVWPQAYAVAYRSV